VSGGYQLNYFWILMLLSGRFKALNWCGIQLSSTPIAAYDFVPSVFGENIQTANFRMISAETAC
jgi:hypothetical protein